MQKDETLLHVAAGFGRPWVLWQLLEHGLAIEAADASGNTPMHAASEAENSNCVEVLRCKGANKEGKTPMVMNFLVGYWEGDFVRFVETDVSNHSAWRRAAAPRAAR